MGQRRLVIRERLCKLQSEVEEIGEVLKDMRKLLAVGGVRTQRRPVSRFGLRKETFPEVLQELGITGCLDVTLLRCGKLLLDRASSRSFDCLSISAASATCASTRLLRGKVTFSVAT